MAKKKTFEEMTRDERAEVVRKDMAAGGSYKSVAAGHGVSVGQIAGICRDYGIPSTHQPPNMGKGKAKQKKPAKKAPAARKAKPAAPKKARKVPDIPGLIESKSEASRCEYKGAHCPYEAKVGTPFCPLHQEDPARR